MLIANTRRAFFCTLVDRWRACALSTMWQLEEQLSERTWIFSIFAPQFFLSFGIEFFSRFRVAMDFFASIFQANKSRRTRQKSLRQKNMVVFHIAGFFRIFFFLRRCFLVILGVWCHQTVTNWLCFWGTVWGLSAIRYKSLKVKPTIKKT